jgi:LmbE family N-acetylglucosaminyl deacetylase
MEFNRLLFLGAHADDELACAGTLNRFLREEKEVFVVIFSYELPIDIVKQELNQSLKILGVNDQNIIRYGLKNRNFPSIRQDILERLIDLRDKIKPDLVLVPPPLDLHQDHCVLNIESFRAFKHYSIFGYESIGNSFTNIQPNCFIEIAEEDLDKKIEMLNCYKSQHFRRYMNEYHLRSIAEVRGAQMNKNIAEAFELLRLQIV